LKVTQRTDPPKNDLIEIGDLIITDAPFPILYLVVGHKIDNNFGLMDMSTSICDLQFTHPAHLINWLKKHHGEFRIVKKDRIELIYD
jgi:hypothetical protein